MKADIAVIVPTFNRAERVARAVRSVLAQTVDPSKIVVVDDGSSDGTRELLAARFPPAGHPQLSVLGYEDDGPANRGASAARNRGVRATGESWVAFLDSDDEWHPTKVERQLQALAESRQSRNGHRYRLCHTDEVWIRNGRQVQPKQRHRKASGHDLPHCLDLCAISPSTVLIERGLLLEVGLFDETLPACEDYDLWLRICHREPVLLVDEPLVTRYAGHTDQLSRQHVAMDRFRIRAIEKLLAEPTLGTEQRGQAVAELARKLAVYRAGSLKRDLHDQVRWCDAVATRAGLLESTPDARPRSQ